MNTELIEKIDAAIEAAERTLVADIIRLVNIKSVKEEPLPGAPFGAGPRAVLDEVVSIARMKRAMRIYARTLLALEDMLGK